MLYTVINYDTINVAVLLFREFASDLLYSVNFILFLGVTLYKMIGEIGKFSQ